MIEAAPGVIDLAKKVDALVTKQQQTLGPAASRWNEFMTGKVGAPNADFTKLRTDADLLKTLLMRMHVGARGGEKILERFDNLLQEGTQSPQNLHAALQEIQDYAQQVSRAGGVTQARTAVEGETPKAAKRYNPQTQKLEDIP
jgi:hypothetical protein